MDLLSLIIALVLPPLAVFLHIGITMQFWINVILTLLGWIPGVLHAIWVLYTF